MLLGVGPFPFLIVSRLAGHPIANDDRYGRLLSEPLTAASASSGSSSSSSLVSAAAAATARPGDSKRTDPGVGHAAAASAAVATELKTELKQPAETEQKQKPSEWFDPLCAECADSAAFSLARVRGSAAAAESGAGAGSGSASAAAAAPPVSEAKSAELKGSDASEEQKPGSSSGKGKGFKKQRGAKQDDDPDRAAEVTALPTFLFLCCLH